MSSTWSTTPDGRDEGSELRHEMALLVGLHGTEEHVGVAREALERRHVGLAVAEEVGHAELLHAAFHVLRVGVEARDVLRKRSVMRART